MSGRDDEARLPKPPAKPLIHGAAGPLLLRPWFDRATLHWVTRVYFPLSRAWAAARWADGDRDAFVERLRLRRPSERAVRALVDALPPAEARHRQARAAWQAAFHADERPPPPRLVAAEVAREAAAQHLMLQRVRGTALHWRHRLPPIELHAVDQATVDAVHAGRLAGPEAAFPAPPRPQVRHSHAVRGHDGWVSWIDWPAPTLGDRATARVVAPADRADPPTFIHLHGIGMELEMWKAREDALNALARRHGLRVVQPEGPWHGSRMQEGYWGGEPALARAPVGYLGLVQAWVAELGQLVAWAKATSRGPVAIGGLSLGALSAQVAACAASHWPAEMQPDALFLCMTSGDMLEVAFEGEMARRLGATEAIRARGWTHDTVARYRPLLEPRGAPAMPSRAIVMHLGRSDVVTPFRGGLALARSWGVPDGNLFVRPRGHFAAPLALGFDTAPLDRLAAILNDRTSGGLPLRGDSTRRRLAPPRVETL